MPCRGYTDAVPVGESLMDEVVLYTLNTDARTPT